MDDDIQPLEAKLQVLLSESFALQMRISQQTQLDRLCEKTHLDIVVLWNALFGWVAQMYDVADCWLLGNEEREEQCASVSVLRSIVGAGARVLQCALSGGRAPACSESAAPWVGVLLTCVVLRVVTRLLWYCAKQCARLYRLKTAQSVLASDRPTQDRLNLRQDAVRNHRRFWVVIKAGCALSLFFIYAVFAVSSTSLLSSVVAFVRLSGGDAEREDTTVDLVWNWIVSVPSHVVGRGTLDGAFFLYALTGVALPLFILIVKCMRSAAEDAKGLVPNPPINIIRQRRLPQPKRQAALLD